MDEKNYYTILGISSNATESEITSAYRKKVKEEHPDKFPNASQEIKEKQTKLTQEINEAYATLSDPTKRKDYDDKLNIKTQSSSTTNNHGNYSNSNTNTNSNTNANQNNSYNNYNNYDYDDYENYEDDNYDEEPENSYYHNENQNNFYTNQNYTPNNNSATKNSGCGCLGWCIVSYLIICGIISAAADINFFAVLLLLPIIFFAFLAELGTQKRR